MTSLAAWKEPVTEQIERLLIGLSSAYAAAGLKLSGNAIIQEVRRHGFTFRTAEAQEVLAACRLTPTDSRRLPDEGKSTPGDSRLLRADGSTRARAAKDLSKRDNDGTSLRSVPPGTSLRSVPGTQNAREKKKTGTHDQTVPPPWVPELRAAVNAFRHATIAELEPEQRLLLGRYHCLRFANCTISEARNKARGRGVAKSFALMAGSKDYGVWTVEEYVKTAIEYHLRIADRAPWFDPFEVRTVIEARPLADPPLRNVTPRLPC